MSAEHTAESDAGEPCLCGTPFTCLAVHAEPSERERVGRRTSRYGDLYTDRNGDRYTTAVMGADGDPWQGATILTRGVVDRLRADDLLPLTEVVRWEPVVKARANVVQAFLRWLNGSVTSPEVSQP